MLRFVDLSDVRIDRALALAPEGGRVLAAGAVPLVWAYDGGGVRIVILAFALEDSDLPLHVAFPILIQNSLAWLGGAIADARVGDDVQVPAGSASSATLTDPDGGRATLRPVDGVFVLPPLARAGLYRLSVAGGADRVFAAEIGSPAGERDPPRARAGRDRDRPGLGTCRACLRPRSCGSRCGPGSWPWPLGAALGEWALATRRVGR